MRILIVEDEALSALMLERQLSMNGFTVLKPVLTGEKAIEVALAERPDIIFMDIRLSGSMDGIEAATRIRAVHSFRLIFTSGYQDGEYYDRAMALDPAAYITKPIVFESLLPFLKG